MNIIHEHPRLQEALLQAKHGHRVHPCHYPTEGGRCSCGKCDPSQHGKHPVLKGWQQIASTAEITIQNWWTREPFCNIGLATGPDSDLLIVDIDIRGKDGFKDLRELDPTGLGFDGIRTPKARTGSGGGQLYFKWPKGCKLTTGAGIRGKAIDFRGIGGNAIAPGSRNNIGAYTWIVSLNDCEKSACPEWLLGFLNNGDERLRMGLPSAKPTASLPGSLVFEVQAGLADHPGADEGERNAMLCKLVGSELAGGTDPIKVMEQALTWNQRCRPPKSPEGIVRSVQSIISSEWASLRVKVDSQKRKTHLQNTPPEPGKWHPPALITRLSADVEEESLTWLWQNRFLTGHINIIAGDPGLGKSLLAVDAAARVSTGRSWPDGSPCQQGKVVYCTTEDAFASVVKPRLIAAGADHNQIIFVEGVMHNGDEGALFLDEHMQLLEDEFEKQGGQVRLLILDTLQSYVGAETNTNNNASSRRIMTPLKRLAEKHQTAVLCLEHLTKGTTQRNATYRVQGSIAFTGAARSVWIVCRDPQDQNRRIVQAGKTNLSPDNESLGLAYTVTGEVGKPYIVWGETDISTPLSELMGEHAGGDDAKGQCALAVEWLRENLTEPTLAKEMGEGLKSEGFSNATIRRAKTHLCIKSKKTAEGWRWMPSPTVSIGGEVIADPMKTSVIAHFGEGAH